MAEQQAKVTARAAAMAGTAMAISVEQQAWRTPVTKAAARAATQRRRSREERDTGDAVRREATAACEEMVVAAVVRSCRKAAGPAQEGPRGVRAVLPYEGDRRWVGATMVVHGSAEQAERPRA